MPTSITMILILSLMIMMISSIISKKTMKDREKSSPFECGFDPKSSARLPFSLRFFLLAIIFLIFDVEIVLLLPIPTLLPMHHNMNPHIMITMLMMMLIIGLLYEWKMNALNWAE